MPLILVFEPCKLELAHYMSLDFLSCACFVWPLGAHPPVRMEVCHSFIASRGRLSLGLFSPCEFVLVSLFKTPIAVGITTECLLSIAYSVIM